jgi:hypothetical protein
MTEDLRSLWNSRNQELAVTSSLSASTEAAAQVVTKQ